MKERIMCLQATREMAVIWLVNKDLCQKEHVCLQATLKMAVIWLVNKDL